MWSMPLAQYPKVSALLPRMASEDIQASWTGAHGEPLLLASISFMRSVAAIYPAITNRPLQGAKILDFGCGYGRFLRLGSFYSDDIWGVDPWSESLRHCREAGWTGPLLLSDYLPNSLPVPKDFNLAIAFSVFTHLSERATKTCLAALRKHVVRGGIACITIRPVEYWRTVYPDWGVDRLVHVEADHRSGFAFVPHNRAAVDGDITYGDTSMTVEWLSAHAAGWEISAFDRSGEDPVQRYVYLRAI